MSTLRRRSLELASQAKLVSGRATGVKAQQVAGLQRPSTAEQEQLLVDAGLKSSKPSDGTALAIKAGLGLPGSQLWKLRQRLTAFGVEIEPEKAIQPSLQGNCQRRQQRIFQ